MSTESAAVIALLQFNATQSSRMFFDHESLAAALDNICALYEKELKLLNPKIANITYDIADLYSYLDALHNISLLMCVPLRAPVVNAFILTHCFLFLFVCPDSYHDPIRGYLPRNKEWIKRHLLTHLRGQAG